MIAPDFRESPTRDDCEAGITILLVGKPKGTLDFFFAGSDVETKIRGRNTFKLEISSKQNEVEKPVVFFCARVTERVEFKSIVLKAGVSEREIKLFVFGRKTKRS